MQIEKQTNPKIGKELQYKTCTRILLQSLVIWQHAVIRGSGQNDNRKLWSHVARRDVSRGRSIALLIYTYNGIEVEVSSILADIRHPIW